MSQEDATAHRMAGVSMCNMIDLTCRSLVFGVGNVFDFHQCELSYCDEYLFVLNK